MASSNDSLCMGFLLATSFVPVPVPRLSRITANVLIMPPPVTLNSGFEVHGPEFTIKLIFSGGNCARG